MRPLFAAAVGIALLLAASAKAEIVVGATLPLSGPAAALGISAQRGLELAPTKIGNESVRYIILDDGSDPSAAVRNVRKLVTENKVDILAGLSNAPAGYAVAPILDELKVPLISMTPIELYGEKSHWFATDMAQNDVWGRLIIQDMKKSGIKRVAYIGYSDTWGDIVHDTLSRLANENGIEVINDERFARSDTTVAAQILKIVALKPDAVMVGASASPAALPTSALIDRNLGIPIYNTDAVIGPAFLRLLGNRTNDILVPTYLDIIAPMLPDGNAVKKPATAFLESFDHKFGLKSLDGQVAAGFDAGIILDYVASRALAIAKPGTAEFREALRDELYKVKDLAGTRGFYSFKPGNPYGLDDRSMVMVKIKDGRWVLKE